MSDTGPENPHPNPTSRPSKACLALSILIDNIARKHSENKSSSYRIQYPHATDSERSQHIAAIGANIKLMRRLISKFEKTYGNSLGDSVRPEIDKFHEWVKEDEELLKDMEQFVAKREKGGEADGEEGKQKAAEMKEGEKASE
ncbi:hypothetical protein BDV96DRAFT_654613 [Lophiotrema nucula]|uniref:Uncharacterized protein n=1 Tax=Lophiotrema nucula TaxID=690887 RepID=A0A6A5YI16_9PLEO|nr:hypothetical protein BDV96DRAFT_654613 [Lophiotrema nucula]